MKGAGTEDSISPSVSGSCLLLLPYFLPRATDCSDRSRLLLLVLLPTLFVPISAWIILPPPAATRDVPPRCLIDLLVIPPPLWLSR